jgi:arylsulfatase A-like enzyme
VVLTSDHGESLGEHDYYFDHGRFLFDPSLRIPLLIVVPDGERGGRADVMCSTLDLVPTVLDAVQVSYPPGLDGVSLIPFAKGQAGSRRERLFAQNERNLSAAWNRRFKVVATPLESGRRFALFDRSEDPEETRDVARERPELDAQQRSLESFLEARDREWEHTRRLTEGRPGDARMTLEACQKLLALGYVEECEE